jgi:hypothetical protein
VRLQVQPNRASCLLTSFAMCIDRQIEELFEILGHDGTEILYSECPVPFCYRGFTHEDIYFLCEKLDFKMYLVSKSVSIYDGEKLITRPNPHFKHIHTCSCNAIVESNTHAVAWDGCEFYNPNGVIQSHFPYHRYIKVKK